MLKNLTLAGLVAALVLPFLAPAEALAGRKEILTTRLWGPQMHATAKCTSTPRSNGRSNRVRLTVNVKQALPFTTFEVRYRDRSDLVGVITTNAAGRGRLRLNGSDVPPMRRGQVISVGPMKGVFVSRLKKMNRRAQIYRVEADLDDGANNGADGEVRYRERFTNRRLRRDFYAEIDDADPNTTYPCW